jgi:hypothetical protein
LRSLRRCSLLGWLRYWPLTAEERQIAALYRQSGSETP